MKLWLDDLRHPPLNNEWWWARTADEAIWYLGHCAIEVASLDHDLADIHYIQEASLTKEQMESYGKEKTGYDVISWMERNGIWPKRVIIHSLNPEGAKKMFEVAGRHTLAIMMPYAGKEIDEERTPGENEILLKGEDWE